MFFFFTDEGESKDTEEEEAKLTAAIRWGITTFAEVICVCALKEHDIKCFINIKEFSRCFYPKRLQNVKNNKVIIIYIFLQINISSNISYY